MLAKAVCKFRCSHQAYEAVIVTTMGVRTAASSQVPELMLSEAVCGGL